MSKTHEFKNYDALWQCPPEVAPELWNQFAAEMKQADNMEVLDFPVQIDVELNAGCNMRCPFCTHGYEKIENTKMDLKHYFRMVDEAVANGAKSLKLNYINEPMLRTDLEDCIKYAKNAGIINIYMATNGSLLSESRRKKLIHSGITKIFVSIDAITPETYAKQRLDGKYYEKIVQNVVNLVEERNALGLEFPKVRVSFLKNALNQGEEKAFEDFWQDKVDVIAFQKMNEVPDRDTGLMVETESEQQGCQFPFKQLVVANDGSILPCCKLYGRKLSLGNIADTTLKQAWDSPKMKNLREIHKSGEWRNHEICRACIQND